MAGGLGRGPPAARKYSPGHSRAKIADGISAFAGTAALAPEQRRIRRAIFRGRYAVGLFARGIRDSERASFRQPGEVQNLCGTRARDRGGLRRAAAPRMAARSNAKCGVIAQIAAAARGILLV